MLWASMTLVDRFNLFVELKNYSFQKANDNECR